MQIQKILTADLQRKQDLFFPSGQVIKQITDHDPRCRQQRRVTYLRQQLCSIVKILPVNPRSQVVHHSLLDLLLDPLVRLSLQLQGLVVIFPLVWGKKINMNERDRTIKEITVYV